MNAVSSCAKLFPQDEFRLLDRQRPADFRGELVRRLDDLGPGAGMVVVADQDAAIGQDRPVILQVVTDFPIFVRGVDMDQGRMDLLVLENFAGRRRGLRHGSAAWE